jgi:hypothetical protein
LIRIARINFATLRCKKGRSAEASHYWSSGSLSNSAKGCLLTHRSLKIWTV